MTTTASSPLGMARERGRPLTSPKRQQPQPAAAPTTTTTTPAARWASARDYSPHSIRSRDYRDYSPHANIRSRDFSPHMSPDRVTRNISPGRQKLQEENMEVRMSQI